MKSVISSKSLLSNLRKRLGDNAPILKDVGQITKFITCISMGSSIMFGDAVSTILKTAGSCISLCDSILTRFKDEDPELSVLEDQNEKFEFLYYITCQQSYLEAIDCIFRENELESFNDDDLEPEKFTKNEEEIIKSIISDVSLIEIHYFLTVEPYDFNVPLYSLYSKWLSNIFKLTGYDKKEAFGIVESVEKKAKESFYLNISKQSSISNWIRNYLIINEIVESKQKINETFSNVKTLIETFSYRLQNLNGEQKEAWDEYKAKLKKLPDKKDSMFNENFGVRRVFVCPEVNYYRQGFDKKYKVRNRDLSTLLGGLLSNRVKNEDLIFLCGGPGSGKSTLCRLLCDQLARMENIHPFMLKLRKLHDIHNICDFIETSMKKEGLINQIKNLKDLNNIVIILDGFDEVVKANKTKLMSLFRNLKDELDTSYFKNAKILIAGRDTLFPDGEGIPKSSHIIELKPFNKSRVKLWGEKWAKTPHLKLVTKPFEPEIHINDKNNALHHLVTWPLTLHLVARIHASGIIDLSSKIKIEKAFIYKSIVFDTFDRQKDKFRDPDDKARLEPKNLHQFIMDIAWHMYIEGKDIIEAEDVGVFLKQFELMSQDYDYELKQIRETAILNTPTFISGDDRGIEFVHKSFLEYFVAEKIAQKLEPIHEKVTSSIKPDPFFGMSDENVIRTLSEILCVQPIADDLLEYLVSMIGTYVEYEPNKAYSEKYVSKDHSKKLNDLIGRLENRYESAMHGNDLPEIIRYLSDTKRDFNILLINSRYMAGLLRILLLLYKRKDVDRFYLFHGIDSPDFLEATLIQSNTSIIEAIPRNFLKYVTAIPHRNNNFLKITKTKCMQENVSISNIYPDLNRKKTYNSAFRRLNIQEIIEGLYIIETLESIESKMETIVEDYTELSVPKKTNALLSLAIQKTRVSTSNIRTLIDVMISIRDETFSSELISKANNLISSQKKEYVFDNSIVRHPPKEQNENIGVNDLIIQTLNSVKKAADAPMEQIMTMEQQSGWKNRSQIVEEIMNYLKILVKLFGDININTALKADR